MTTPTPPQPAPEVRDPAAPAESAPSPPDNFGAGKAIALFAVYLGAQALGSILAVLAYGLAGRDVVAAILEFDAELVLVAGTAGVALGGLAVLGVTRVFSGGRTWEEAMAPFGWVRSSGQAIAGAGALGVGTSVVALITVPLIFPPGESTEGPLVQAASAPGWSRILFAVLAVVLAPLIEEFLFRGVMFEGFKRTLGVGRAAVVVTTLFVVMHVPDTLSYPPSLLSIAAVAVALLMVRIRTGSLLPAIALHSAFNLTQVVILYLFEV